MHWFKSKEKAAAQNSRFASASEIQSAFAEYKESLNWAALLITGDSKLASQSMVDASGLAQTNSYVFRDWLSRWANTATARAAVQIMRGSIQDAAENYAHWNCSHANHDPLAQEEISLLQKRDPIDLVQVLDPLARAVLVLRGCQQASIADCVLLVNVPLRSVVGAYCRALQFARDILQSSLENSDSQPTNTSVATVIQSK